MNSIHHIRGLVLPVVVLLALLSLVGLAWSSWFWLGVAVTLPLVALGFYDIVQTRHNLLRNYPILGHLRFLLEGTGPEIHQYFIESNTDGRPFSRDSRNLMYQRSKGIAGVKPFGTELDVYALSYGFLAHSIHPAEPAEDPSRSLRVRVGGPACQRPYSASLVNISAMSFGALSASAVRALNTAAQRGGFAHNTGEGGLSVHHKEPGGDVIWQVGTGYFGCRDAEGHFDVESFSEQARLEQVKMIELKISQGAKPGHGGILPGAKVTPEIAEARRVPVGQDCLSPPGHTAFDSPIGLCELIQTLREHSGGKPVGFKLALGRPIELFSIFKAMLETQISPDFITVDGAEGGTGAAPQEYSDHLGMPLHEALLLVHNGLVGTGLREHIRLAASDKRIDSFQILNAMALGADWVNVARGFMFSLGCIQSQSCHTNQCPVGVATQDGRLQRALVVEDKAERALTFHRKTVEGIAEMAAACGLEHPGDIQPDHVYRRIDAYRVDRLDRLYEFMEPGQILDGRIPHRFAAAWEAARADHFAPVSVGHR